MFLIALKVSGVKSRGLASLLMDRRLHRHKTNPRCHQHRGPRPRKEVNPVDNVVLTADQLAHIACLTRQQQLDLLKELTTGKYLLAWDAERHEWVLVPVD